MLPSTSVLQLLFVSVFRRSFFATPISHLPVLCKCCFCLLFRRPCHRHAKLTSASVAQVLLPSFVRRPCPRRDMIPSTYVVQALFLYFFVAPILGMPSSRLSRLCKCRFYLIVVAPTVGAPCSRLPMLRQRCFYCSSSPLSAPSAT